MEQDIKDNIRIEYINGTSINTLAKKHKCGSAKIIEIIGNLKRNKSEAGKIKKPMKHSEQSKEKLRIARLKYMKENPHKTAWRSKNPSYIEKCFKSYIIDNKWNEEFLITTEKSIFPYFIDFAFENEKVAVELDGTQHLNKEIIERDFNKDQKLNESGWSVYRITGGAIKNNMTNTMNELYLFLKSKQTIIINISVGINDYKKIPKLDRLSRKGIHRTENENIGSYNQRKVKNRPEFYQLLKDITNLGYKGTGKKYNVSDNCIRKWIKRYQDLTE